MEQVRSNANGGVTSGNPGMQERKDEMKANHLEYLNYSRVVRCHLLCNLGLIELLESSILRLEKWGGDISGVVAGVFSNKKTNGCAGLLRCGYALGTSLEVVQISRFWDHSV